jgi:hypothetical protein
MAGRAGIKKMDNNHRQTDEKQDYNYRMGYSDGFKEGQLERLRILEKIQANIFTPTMFIAKEDLNTYANVRFNKNPITTFFKNLIKKRKT